jgi:hypothetical protein
MERWPFRHRANAIQHDERHLEQSKNVQEGLSEYKQIGESDDYPKAGVEHEEAGPDPVEVVAPRLDRIVITGHQRAGERSTNGAARTIKNLGKFQATSVL